MKEDVKSAYHRLIYFSQRIHTGNMYFLLNFQFFLHICNAYVWCTMHMFYLSLWWPSDKHFILTEQLIHTFKHVNSFLFIKFHSKSNFQVKWGHENVIQTHPEMTLLFSMLFGMGYHRYTKENVNPIFCKLTYHFTFTFSFTTTLDDFVKSRRKQNVIVWFDVWQVRRDRWRQTDELISFLFVKRILHRILEYLFDHWTVFG